MVENSWKVWLQSLFFNKKLELKNLEWSVTIYKLNRAFHHRYLCVCVLSRFSLVLLFVTPWAATCYVSLYMGFSRQEYWTGLPCSLPGDLPDPGIKRMSLALQADSLPTEPRRKPYRYLYALCCEDNLLNTFNFARNFLY